MNGDGELFTGRVGRTDMRAGENVPSAEGIGGRAEVKRAPEEDAVDRTHDRPPVACDRRERQEPHPGQSLSQFLRIDPSLGRDDCPEVRAGDGIAAVEQILECSDVIVVLVQSCRFNHRVARPCAVRSFTRRASRPSLAAREVPLAAPAARRRQSSRSAA
jgi:hypothetical protein